MEPVKLSKSSNTNAPIGSQSQSQSVSIQHSDSNAEASALMVDQPRDEASCYCDDAKSKGEYSNLGTVHDNGSDISCEFQPEYQERRTQKALLLARTEHNFGGITDEVVHQGEIGRSMECDVYSECRARPRDVADFLCRSILGNHEHRPSHIK